MDLASIDNINEWNYKMDLLGMDSISAGTTIGFAMELREKGLWDNGLGFGKAENISQLLEDIAYRRGVGNDLADGVKRLAARYGGEDFAPHVKGLELAAYEPRGAVGHGLGYATASRGGCHLDGGYVIFYERIIPTAWDPYDTKSKPSLVVLSQSLMGAVSSLGSCLFSALSALPPIGAKVNKDGIVARIVSKILTMSYKTVELTVRMPAWALSIHPPFSMIPNTKVFETLTGMHMRLGDLLFVGYRGYILERCFNLREGLTPSHDTLAKRFMNVQQIPGRPETVVNISEMLPTYYRLRGIDKNGVPKQSELKRLGLDFVKL
jgi:aldehyde:ferredoxin oxidoreductase